MYIQFFCFAVLNFSAKLLFVSFYWLICLSCSTIVELIVGAETRDVIKLLRCWLIV